MEDTHWDFYTNGVYEAEQICLNPCFNGRYSLRPATKGKKKTNDVLILVLMEDTHWGPWNLGEERRYGYVLILVLMEDTHWVKTFDFIDLAAKS